MRRLALITFALLVSGFCLRPTHSQEKEDRTLLSGAEMRAIINESSGERAQHHVLEMVPYPRVRERTEYKEHFRESLVVRRFAQEYGFQNVEIEEFPGGQPSWLATQAELWMTAPESRKLYDVYDVAVSVCSGSEPGDVSADVVDVGIGARAEDYAGKDVAGKIVLGSAGAGILQRLAVFERGAVGVLSYNSMRPDSFPDQILSQSISSNAPQGKKPGFGWSIAPRLARELSQRLGQGGQINLRSIVKSETFPGKMEMVHATIPGDGSTDQEMMVSAHLYEGYIKQGANDDASGCALTLEMGRAYLRLVQEGKLPRPRRNIHFLWVPEISGTMAWLNRHQDMKKKLIGDLNFDMEGLGLRPGYSQWVMHRTPDSFPSFLNDLCAGVLEYVANLNRERVRYRHNGYGFTLPVTAPNGSWDPFYYIIEKHYGASDHSIYLNQGIPAIMFITWPDMNYHSSQDTPDKLDTTQFKRAAVVGIGCMSALASAGDEMASRVAAEALARGAGRMGEAERKGLAYLSDAAEGQALTQAYKEARNSVLHQAGIEKGVMRSSAPLFADPAAAGRRLSAFETLIDRRAAALLDETRAFYQLKTGQQNLPSGDPAASDDERKAARTMVQQTGGSMGGFGGRGAMQQALDRLPAEQREAVQRARAKVPVHMQAELSVLLGRGKSVLEIRDFLSGEFEPLALADLTDYLRAQEKLGTLKLVEKQ